MHVSFKFFFAAWTLNTMLLAAAAAPSPVDLAVPKFRKGIWATKHYQELSGARPRQYPEHILEQCVDPAESIRRGLLSGEKNGCEIKLNSTTGNTFDYSSVCPTGTVRMIVETASPTEYRTTTTSHQARDVQVGHWVRDCPTANDLPLPDLKKGIWSVVTEVHRFDPTSQTTSERVLNLCASPVAFIRQEMRAAESGGCNEWRLLGTGDNLGFNSMCTGKAFTFGVDSASATEFRIRKGFSGGVTVTTARWVGDCYAGSVQNDATTEPSR